MFCCECTGYFLLPLQFFCCSVTVDLSGSSAVCDAVHGGVSLVLRVARDRICVWCAYVAVAAVRFSVSHRRWFSPRSCASVCFRRLFPIR